MRLKDCRDFAKKYANIILIVFSTIISKRVILEEKISLEKLAYNLIIIGITLAFLKLHAYSDIATRVMPIIMGGLSYYGHIHGLVMKLTLKQNAIYSDF